MDQKHILYGTEFSLYTGKVRAYLRYKGIPYQETLSTLNVYRKIIIPQTGVRFIPVVQTPHGEYLQDTTDIIDTLEPRFAGREIYPQTPAQNLTSLLFELLGDEWLLIPAMHYRWNFPAQNEKFIMGEFGSIIAPWAPAIVRRFAGRMLAKNFSGMLPMLGITDKTIPAIEAWYEEFLGQLDTHFSQHNYLLGERASMGDFGLVAPLYAHLYRDPAPGELMRRLAPNVARWVERMNLTEPAIGDWLPDDEVPDTLLPILQRQFAEQFPFLQSTAAALQDWQSNHAGHKEQRLPRTIGNHTFSLGDAQAERALIPFSLWMAQRPVDYYASLSGAEKAAAKQLLASVQGEKAMDLGEFPRLARKHNRLVLA